jgi:hypothetical protein
MNEPAMNEPGKSARPVVPMWGEWAEAWDSDQGDGMFTMLLAEGGFEGGGGF